MSKSQNQKLEEQLKKQLDLKYSSASQLLKEAKENLGIGPDEVLDEEREFEVIDEAIIIYEDDLTPEEREEMKRKAAGEPGAEPEWKRKARLAAEKREKEWEQQNQREQEAQREAARQAREQEQLQQQQQQRRSQPPPPPQPVEAVPEQHDPDMEPVVTRVVRKKSVKGSVSNKKPGEVTTCYCVIL